MHNWPNERPSSSLDKKSRDDEEMYPEQQKREIKLTIPVAAYQSNIVTGNATIYLTLLVKFSNKKKFPTNPHAKLAPFNPKHHFGS